MGLSKAGVTADVRNIPGALRLDEIVGGTPLYLGVAAAASLEAAAVWQIQRISFPTPGQDDTVIEWADGDIKFDNVWDDRLTISYS